MRKFLNISLLSVFWLFLGCQSNEPQNNQQTTNTAPSVSSDTAAQPNASKSTEPTEPIFLSEGELSFVDASGKELSKLEIEIVDNAADRQKGLMFRKSMPEHRGMLFIFETEEPQAFWMKNTLMSLDIIYVDNKNTVVSIQKRATPLNEKSLPSEKPAIYVVETNAGYADKFGIKEGVKINFKKY